MKQQYTILLAILGLVFQQSSALKIAQKNVTDMLTLTYVYGGEDAMLTHEEAMDFCRNLQSKIANINVATSTMSSMSTQAATTNEPATNSADAQDRVVERSDLLSIHELALVDELMEWIKSIDSHQFWIGGLLKIVLDDFRHGREHIIQLWTDHTLANFRFIQYPNEILNTMRPGDINCISVDYSSGKWGVHPCETPMYFVCETIRLKARELESEDLTTLDSSASPSTQAPTTISN